jgi:hypothetical protein
LPAAESEAQATLLPPLRVEHTARLRSHLAIASGVARNASFSKADCWARCGVSHSRLIASAIRTTLKAG